MKKQHSCWSCYITDTVNPGKLLPQLDDGGQAHLVHEEGDGPSLMVKKASIAGSLDQLEFRVKSTGEMLGPDKCSGDDKGLVVVATF